MPTSNEHPKDTVYLTDGLPFKGPHISLLTENADLLERFRCLAYLNLPKSLLWFHQCSSADYHMFEFWNPDTEAMNSVAQDLAHKLSLPLLVDLQQDYTAG